MNTLHVVGARPNFMKVAPVMAALSRRPGVSQVLVHTGQHYDPNMSDIFFRELRLPRPDVNLEVGSGSHARQTAEVMLRFEPVVLERRPDWVLVYGDINSTVAAALVCAKIGVRAAHVEAGLRSFDRTMPEEINRLVTDQIVDLLLTPSMDGNDNLRREGIPYERVHFVGNVMIDTLVRLLPEAEALWPVLRRELGLAEAPRYGLVTLHRPSNADDPTVLTELMTALAEIAEEVPLVFPLHPRTRRRLADLDLLPPDAGTPADGASRPSDYGSPIAPHSSPFTLHPSPLTHYGLRVTEPLGYLEFLALQRHAALVITDSGGIQEETTYLGVPCFTMRENTERPVTVTVGTNTLIGHDVRRLRREVTALLRGDRKEGQVPLLWDGHAGERIADILLSHR
ncbi:MAG: UDP-N-acetyl glucosamine 2-epimerase [Armatimonadetes bacterium]|nr:UDP-N-acetyl glucosamine 2-epimerase [Armatimonadota bacterium]